MHLFNGTIFEANAAPHGRSFELINGSIHYTLPAPPGRWVNVRQGNTFFGLETEELDFPFACSPGVVGGSTPEVQKAPGCWKPWCATQSQPAST